MDGLKARSVTVEVLRDVLTNGGSDLRLALTNNVTTESRQDGSVLALLSRSNRYNVFVRKNKRGINEQIPRT